MKKLFFRLIAYALDLLFLNIILIGLSNISFANNNIDKVNSVTNRYMAVSKQYADLSSKFEEYLYDHTLSSLEYMHIEQECPYFFDAAYKIGDNKQFDEETKNQFIEDVNNTYKYYYNEYVYSVNKYNVKMNVISAIISILYFGVFEWYMKGKTIGKKILRLRTVNNNDPKEPIPLYKYLIKALLISEAMFIVTNIILVNVMDMNTFPEGYRVLSNVEYIYNIVFLLTIFIRRDERSIHDVLLGIRVALFDKNNKEVKSTIFNEEITNKAN